jgi:hypothetical protein
MLIRVPEIARSFLGKSEFEYENTSSRSNAFFRDKELEFCYERTDEKFVNDIYVLFMDTENPKEKLLYDLLPVVNKLAEEYVSNIDFSSLSHKDENDLKAEEEEMYFTEDAHRESAKVIFSSFLLIPFCTSSHGVERSAYRLFWAYFDALNKVNIREKIERIIHGKYISSMSDTRFWELAAMHGETKEKWLINIYSNLTSKALMKFEIGRNFPVYCQVLVKESLNFAIRKNFNITLTIGESVKINSENPDNFLSTILLEDELKKYVKENPKAFDIIVSNEYKRPVRMLTLLVLDMVTSISADHFIKASSDIYYKTVIKKVAVDVLMKQNLYILADIIINGVVEQFDGATRKVNFVKTDNDSLFNKSINNFFNYILNNFGQYERSELKSELIRFAKIIVLSENVLEILE